MILCSKLLLVTDKKLRPESPHSHYVDDNSCFGSAGEVIHCPGNAPISEKQLELENMGLHSHPSLLTHSLVSNCTMTMNDLFFQNMFTFSFKSIQSSMLGMGMEKIR